MEGSKSSITAYDICTVGRFGAVVVEEDAGFEVVVSASRGEGKMLADSMEGVVGCESPALMRESQLMVVVRGAAAGVESSVL